MALPKQLTDEDKKGCGSKSDGVCYSHGSLILFPTILHKYLQLESQHFSVTYFNVVFGFGVFFNVRN